MYLSTHVYKKERVPGGELYSHSTVMHLRSLLLLIASTLCVATPVLAVSYRARIAQDRMRKYAAHPDFGVTEKAIDDVARKRALSPRQDAVDPYVVR